MQDRRFSHQRERIYAAVLNSHAHPTAEMVYQRLKPEMPRLSLGTVYRNLRQMAAGGFGAVLMNGALWRSGG